MDLLKEALEIQEELRGIQHYIHENAEIGFELDKTVALVCQKLKEYGYEPQVIGNNSVVALIGPPGKTLLLRADMDALPIQECTGLPYESQNGNMHACGHDFHTTMLLGAAKLLKRHESELRGTVKLFWQPAEETVLGCQNALDAGLMENPHVDAAVAIHTTDGKRGGRDVVFNSGLACASCDNYKIIIHGKSAHGAGPSRGLNPIIPGAHIALALHNVVAGETDGMDTIVLTTCKFASGHAQNVVPDSAEMLGTMRTLKKEVREKARRRVEEIAVLTGQMFGAKVDFEWTASVPSLVNNDELMSAASKYVREMEGLNVEDGTNLSLGSEDFALITDLVPGIYVRVACLGDDEGKHPNTHGPNVVYNSDRLFVGAAVYSKIAVSWLKDNN